LFASVFGVVCFLLNCLALYLSPYRGQHFSLLVYHVNSHISSYAPLWLGALSIHRRASFLFGTHRSYRLTWRLLRKHLWRLFSLCALLLQARCSLPRADPAAALLQCRKPLIRRGWWAGVACTITPAEDLRYDWAWTAVFRHRAAVSEGGTERVSAAMISIKRRSVQRYRHPAPATSPPSHSSLWRASPRSALAVSGTRGG